MHEGETSSPQREHSSGIPFESTERRSGIIQSVEGRGSSTDKGLSAVHEMTIASDGDRTMNIQRFVPDTLSRANYRPIATAKFCEFSVCPICLSPEPQSREHVPPRGLGGEILTLTCHRCNNKLGSTLEAELQDWFDDALQVRFEKDATPGFRRARRFLLRQTSEGEAAFVIDKGTITPEVAAMLESGAFTVHPRPPDLQRCKLAVLKSAYLASCLFIGEVPSSAKARAIRPLLVEVRDAPKNTPILDDPIITATSIGRSFKPASGATTLCIEVPSIAEAVSFHISLAGTVITQWPLEPLQLMP